MAYNKQKQRILAGSLNLLPPGDKIPDGDSLQLTNWRVDQTGQLRSRRPVKRISSDLGAPVHTLFSSASDNFAIAGQQLYTGTAFSTSLGSATFSGDPCGIVKYQGYHWFMDHGRQVKLKAGSSTLWNWTPAAPGSAPTAAASGTAYQTGTPLAAFDSSDTWTLDNGIIGSGNPIPAAASFGYDTGPGGSGASVKVTIPSQPDYTSGGVPYKLHRAPSPALDLRLNGQANTSDIFYFSCKSDAAESLDYNHQFFVWLADSSGRILYWNIPFSGASVNGQWFTFQVKRTIVPVNQFTTHSAWIGDAAFDWAHVSYIDIEAWPDRPCNFWYSGLQVGSGASSPGTGVTGSDVTYCVTFANDNEHESNGSPASGTVTLSAQGADLVAIPTSVDPQVTKRHIYRRGGGSSTYLRVGTINDNTTTTFTDQASVADAQAAGIALPLDHDPAPPCRGVVGPYYGKLIAFNSAAHPNRYWWTPTAQPSYFPGSDDDGEGNWEDCGEDGEAIVAIVQHKTMLVIYKERSIWRLMGDPDTNDPVQCNADVGILGGMRAAATWGTQDFFRAAGGSYAFNGDTESKLSQKIEPLFRGESVTIDTGQTVAAINPAVNCAMGAKAGHVYLSYAEVGQSSPNVLLVYNIADGNWTQESLDSSLGAAPRVFFWEGAGGRLYAGIGSAVFEVDSDSPPAYSDDGHAISLVWQSGFSDQGAPNNPKMYADLAIDGKTAATLTASLILEDGTVHSLGTFTSSTRTTKLFSLGSIDGDWGPQALRAAVRITGSVSALAEVYAVYLHFYVLPRKALTFDSGVIDLGTWRDKQVDAVEFDLVSAASAITPKLYTDLPGGTLVQRRSGSMAATTGAALRRLVFSVTDTRKLRLQASSTGQFQLSGARLRTRQIAAFIDGTNSEVFETQPLGLGQSGVDYVSSFREVELDIETAGTMSVEWWTDLPGDGLAQRYTANLTATERCPVRFRVPGDSKGRLYKIRASMAPLTGDGGKIIFAGVPATFLTDWEDQTNLGDHSWGNGSCKVEFDADGWAYLTYLGTSGATTMHNDFGWSGTAYVGRSLGVDGPIKIPHQFATGEELILTIFSYAYWAPELLATWYSGAGSRNADEQIHCHVRSTSTTASWGRIYGGRVFARNLGTAETQGWQWVPIPLLETSPVFQWVDLPIDGVE